MTEDLQPWDMDTRTRIMTAAGPIFAAHGFARATVRDICRAANVNVASIKYHFGDKRGLYVATVDLARQLRADQHPFPVPDSGTAAEDRLYEFVATLLRRLMALKPAQWPIQLLVRELMQPSGACRTLVQEHFRPMFDSLLEIVDELAPRRLEPSERFKAGFSIIGQCLHYRFGNEVVALMVPEPLQSHFGVEQLANHITRFTLAALAGYQETAPPASAAGSSPGSGAPLKDPAD